MPDIATALHNIFDSKEVQSSSSTTGSSAPPENSKKSDHFDMPDISSTLYRSRVEPISSSSSGSTSTSAPRYVPKPIAQPARYAIPSPGALNALRVSDSRNRSVYWSALAIIHTFFSASPRMERSAPTCAELREIQRKRHVQRMLQISSHITAFRESSPGTCD